MRRAVVATSMTAAADGGHLAFQRGTRAYRVARPVAGGCHQVGGPVPPGGPQQSSDVGVGEAAADVLAGFPPTIVYGGTDVGGDHGAVADGHPGHDGGLVAEPRVIADQTPRPPYSVFVSPGRVICGSALHENLLDSGQFGELEQHSLIQQDVGERPQEGA
ncbi:hypothetical protein ACIBI9_22640 [Nonomuraea sp. NPDC050451]|uniref:hypothetical protein n=1 Tax=Nonomuraea sp. NPDC050451 TaxID=3364364 RepID=UPI003788C561